MFAWSTVIPPIKVVLLFKKELIVEQKEDILVNRKNGTSCPFRKFAVNPTNCIINCFFFVSPNFLVAFAISRNFPQSRWFDLGPLYHLKTEECIQTAAKCTGVSKSLTQNHKNYKSVVPPFSPYPILSLPF